MARSRTHVEGLGLARLSMVLSSMSPLFVLWAILGNGVIDDRWFTGVCVSIVVFPNAFLLLRIHTARKRADKCELAVKTAEDHRDHLLPYLFAMLLPLYAEQLESWQHLWAAAAGVTFLGFLFWHLNLHYMNPAFAMYGYRVLTVYPSDDGNPPVGTAPHAVITRRPSLAPGDRVAGYRLGNTVFLAEEKGRAPLAPPAPGGEQQ